MKVLVTGANGMLATHTIIQLLEEGYRVKALLRKKEKYQLDPHPSVELVTGDILNKKAVEEAMAGCDALVHAAALTAPNIPNYDPYFKVNVVGTRNLMETAVRHHLKRVVYVSSANTIGHGDLLNPGKEGEEVKPPFRKSFYARSKKEAEELVKSFSKKIHTVVVNPSFMIGAYDAGPGSGRIVLMGYNKRVAFYPPGGKNFVNTKDVASGIISALKKGANGKNYLLTGENLTYREFFDKMRGEADRKTLLVRIPPAGLLGMGYLAKIPQLLRIPTSFSLANMKILCAHNYYNNARAKRELDIHFSPVEEGIREAADFFKSRNML